MAGAEFCREAEWAGAERGGGRGGGLSSGMLIGGRTNLGRGVVGTGGGMSGDSIGTPESWGRKRGRVAEEVKEEGESKEMDDRGGNPPGGRGGRVGAGSAGRERERENQQRISSMVMW